MNSGIRYRLATASLGAIAALVIGSTLLMISSAFTSLPYYDSWGLYPNAIPDLKALIHGHNEHVIATIKACFWLDQALSSSSGHFTIACIVITCAVPALAIYLLVRTHGELLGADPRDNVILGLALLCLGYAGVQFTNLVWQFQIGFVAAYALSLAALCCQAASMFTSRQSLSWAWLVAGLALATLASYGLFGGTLVWPAMVVFACLGRRKAQLGVVLLVGALVALPYLINLLAAPVGHGIGEGKVVKFLLAWLGSPAGGMVDTNYLPVYNVSVRLQVGIAALAGVLTLVAFGWLSLRILDLLGRTATDRGVLLLMPLWLFCWIVLVSGLLAAIGRSYLPLNEAISSRYTTPPLIMWACMCGLWIQLSRMNKVALHRFKTALVLMSLAILASQADRLAQSSLHGSRMAQAESAALNNVPDLSAMAGVYPTPETVIPFIGRLRDARASLFRPGAWPKLGENVHGWSTSPSSCQVKVSEQATTYGKVLWHATLMTPAPDHSWRLVYIRDQQIEGLGVPQNPRGALLSHSEVSQWLGYAPNSTMGNKSGKFALASAEQKTVILCNWEQVST